MSSSVFNITPNCIKAVSLGATESYNALRPYNSSVVLDTQFLILEDSLEYNF